VLWTSEFFAPLQELGNVFHLVVVGWMSILVRLNQA
jgi:ABC-type transport system involved in cytochrome bd biosynthesis fused ATPase/permease subunit